MECRAQWLTSLAFSSQFYNFANTRVASFGDAIQKVVELVDQVLIYSVAAFYICELGLRREPLTVTNILEKRILLQLNFLIIMKTFLKSSIIAASTRLIELQKQVNIYIHIYITKYNNKYLYHTMLTHMRE